MSDWPQGTTDGGFGEQLVSFQAGLQRALLLVRTLPLFGEKSASLWFKSLFHHLLFVLAILAILSGFGMAFYQLMSEKMARENMEVTAEERAQKTVFTPPPAQEAPPPEHALIVVDVSGAVVHPGLYRVSNSVRLLEAIESAGGFSPEADTSWIAHHLNLAESVADAQKIFIPAVGDTPSIPDGVGESDSKAETARLGTARLSISVNKSAAEELDEIEGLGEKRIGEIIAGRPYVSWEDFALRVKLPQPTLQLLKERAQL